MRLPAGRNLPWSSYPQCQGRLRLLGAIIDRVAVRKVLLHLGDGGGPAGDVPPRGVGAGP
jgi:hypothetical protein